MGFNENQIFSLAALAAATEAIPISQLADRAGISRAGMTGMIDSFEKLGLAARRLRIRGDDRRNVGVEITTAGREALADFIAKLNTALEGSAQAVVLSS